MINKLLPTLTPERRDKEQSPGQWSKKNSDHRRAARHRRRQAIFLGSLLFSAIRFVDLNNQTAILGPEAFNRIRPLMCPGTKSGVPM